MGINPIRPTVVNILNFLQECRQSFQLGYSAMNTARSAIAIFSTCDGAPLSSHQDISLYMKGVRNQSPHLPRYESVWDADIVLTYLKSLGPPSSLSLKSLTIKLTTLLLLSSGHRVQTLEHLTTDHMALSADRVTFHILTKLKHTRTKGTELMFKAFPQDISLCVLAHLKEYLSRTIHYRNSAQLLLSYQKPYAPVCTQTLSRWVRSTLKAAGIDLQVFAPHSIRASSSAAAKRGGATIDTILQAGSWSHSSTFSLWYDKPIVTSPSFQEAVLSNFI